MNTTRAQRADDTYKTLFQSGRAASPTDPELLEMLQRNIFGEAFHIGDLSMRERELITVAALTTLQTLPQLKAHINAALNVGASPLEIRETIYNCAAFIGFPRVLNAVGVFNETAKERGIALPLQNAGATTDADRHAKGLEIQTAVYGDEVKKAMADLPAEYKDVIPDTLTDFCFGDIYTRGGLSLKERELLVFGRPDGNGRAKANPRPRRRRDESGKRQGNTAGGDASNRLLHRSAERFGDNRAD